VSFDFNLGVFEDEALRERAIDHFVQLLISGLEEPGRRIDEIDLLRPAERARLLTPEDSTELRGELLPTVVEPFERQVVQDAQIKVLSARLVRMGV
jgi:non-ribosomal peptide synthetase component F